MTFNPKHLLYNKFCIFFVSHLINTLGEKFFYLSLKYCNSSIKYYFYPNYSGSIFQLFSIDLLPVLNDDLQVVHVKVQKYQECYFSISLSNNSGISYTLFTTALLNAEKSKLSIAIETS